MAFQEGRDLEIYRGNYGAQKPVENKSLQTVQQAGQDFLAGLKKPAAAPMGAPAAGIQEPQDPGLESLQAAVGGPEMMQPPDATMSTMSVPGTPGQMRPNLATRRPPPEDGGLRALQRKVY